MKTHVISILLSLFAVAPSNGETVVPQNVTSRVSIQNGLDLANGNTLEGSSEFGGIQPDYLIDLDDPQLEYYLELAKDIGEGPVGFWDKVRQLNQLIREEMLSYVGYSDPRYLRLLARAREENRAVRLSEYLRCKAGVCREYSLFGHFALKAAGIPNRYVNAQINRDGKTEDHAFLVVIHEGTEWIIDPYYTGFNGFRLSDVMTSRGITEESPRSPLAKFEPGFRKVIQIYSFPKIRNPKGKSRKSKCSEQLISF